MSSGPTIEGRETREPRHFRIASPTDPVIGETRWRGEFAARILRSRGLIVLLVGLGVLLRVTQYWANRSLWHDEALLALNLIDRPLSQATKPLDFGQAVPVGFLVTEAITARVLGFSEYVLRLFPLVCGLLSIPAFVWLSRRILAPIAAPFAILLFIVADGLVYYSSELKPYETDVAVAVALLAVGNLLAATPPLRGRTIALVAIVGGTVLIAFSFPSTFLIAALALTFAFRLAFNRQKKQLRSAESFAVFVWSLASIGIAIYGATRGREIRQSLEAASGRFLGVTGSSPVHALNDIGTNIAQALGLPQHPPYSQVMKLALLCALLGGVSLLRRNRTQLSMLILPVALLFAASAAHAYPILERTELFLLPAIILLIVEGVAQLVQWAPARAKIMTAFVLALLLAAGPVSLAAKGLVHPRTTEEIKPVLRFIREHWQRGDTLYVHHGAQYALLYYQQCRCFRLSERHGSRDLWPLKRLPGGTSQDAQAATGQSSDVIVGRHFRDDRGVLEDLGLLRHRRRVWILYTHLNGQNERMLVEDLLGSLGSADKRIYAIDRPGAHAYLFRVRSPE